MECKNTLEEALNKENSRPQLFAVRPNIPTAGSLMEIIYRCEPDTPPPALSIFWNPMHGQTSIRFKEGDWRNDSYGYAISIDVPPGTESAVVRDAFKISRQLIIKINYEATSRKTSKFSGIKRLFKLSD